MARKKAEPVVLDPNKTPLDYLAEIRELDKEAAQIMDELEAMLSEPPPIYEEPEPMPEVIEVQDKQDAEFGPLFEA